jgi:hypothetical protein
VIVLGPARSDVDLDIWERGTKREGERDLGIPDIFEAKRMSLGA